MKESTDIENVLVSTADFLKIVKSCSFSIFFFTKNAKIFIKSHTQKNNVLG